jgi:hypothetical protein
MDARAIGNDSIVFEGHFDPITQKWQGQLHSYSRSPYTREPTRFESTIIKHLKIITLDPGNGQVTFYRNENINKYGASTCIFYQNKLIKIFGAATGCNFLQNDTVLGVPTSGRSNISRFYFSNNIFVSNKSGLIIQDNANGPVLITRCVFRNNPETAVNIQANTFADYIDENLFIQNTSNNSSSVIRSRNYTVFRNNTLINNQGACDLLLTDPDSTGTGGEILNNIFWNSSGKRATLKLQGSASILNICHNSFGGDSTCMIVPIDTNVTVTNNHYSTYPEFADTLHDNYRLKETSSLIDKGIDIEHGPVMSDFYYSKDFMGFPRKTGLAIDPGAYEYHAIMPLAFHYVTPDTVVCDKDTITLKAIPEGGFTENNMIFTWYWNGSKNSDSNSPYFVVQGNYINVESDFEAEITNGIDTIRSGPIHLSKLQKPDLSSQSSYQLACYGRDLSLNVPKPQVKTNYWWTSAKQGPLGQPTSGLILPDVFESDTLSITATNACGSAQSGPIIIRVTPLPAPSLGPDTTLHAGDSLLLNAGDGVRYAWRAGETGMQIYGYPNDTTWITVTNAYGCTGSDTIVISMIPSGLDGPEARDLEFLLYPNPARDRIFIRIPEEVELPCRLQLVALNGAVVFEAVLPNKGPNECNLTSLEKGTYTVNLLAGAARGIGRLVIW